MKSGVFDRYDRDEALQFIGTRTEIDGATAAVVLTARDLYRLGVGVDAAPVRVDHLDTAALRAKYPKLFPPDVVRSAYVSPKLEREFVMLESGADEATVRRVFGAERDYATTRASANRRA